MNPAYQAANVYQLEPCANTFLEDLSYYLEHGFVHSTPDYFVMARPVCSAWPNEWIVNPLKHHKAIARTRLTERIDQWHIALMAGDMREAWSQFPYELPFISMERKNKLHTYDYDRFRDRLLQL